MRKYKYSELRTVLKLLEMLNNNASESELRKEAGEDKAIVTESVWWRLYKERTGEHPSIEGLLREDGSAGIVSDGEFQELCRHPWVRLSGMDGSLTQHVANALWLKKNAKDFKANDDGSYQGTVETQVFVDHPICIWGSEN